MTQSQHDDIEPCRSDVMAMEILRIDWRLVLEGGRIGENVIHVFPAGRSAPRCPNLLSFVLLSVAKKPTARAAIGLVFSAAKDGLRRLVAVFGRAPRAAESRRPS